MKQLNLFPWFVAAVFFGVGSFLVHHMLPVAAEEPATYWLEVVVYVLFLMSLFCVGQILGRVVTYRIIKHRTGR